MLTTNVVDENIDEGHIIRCQTWFSVKSDNTRILLIFGERFSRVLEVSHPKSTDIPVREEILDQLDALFLLYFWSFDYELQ